MEGAKNFVIKRIRSLAREKSERVLLFLRNLNDFEKSLLLKLFHMKEGMLLQLNYFT